MDAKYVIYNTDTGSIGFYIEGIHTKIPDSAKLIEDDAYDFFMENNGMYTIDETQYDSAEKITKEMLMRIEPQIEQLRQGKLQEISSTCQSVIYTGVDVETSLGLMHFSLTEPDQLNLTGMATQLEKALLGQPSNVDINKGVAYHADGELCRFWIPEDFAKIAYAAIGFVFYNQTYCNHLRQHIKDISDYEELVSVYYGMELPAELQASMANLLGGEINEQAV